MRWLPHVYAGIHCTPPLSDSRDFTYSGWDVCAWKITSHAEIISIAFRGYVNVTFNCINFLLIISKDYALLSWHPSLNLLYSSVKWLLVQCHILEQLFFSHTSAKEMFRNSQLFWEIAGEKSFMCFGLQFIKFLSEQKFLILFFGGFRGIYHFKAHWGSLPLW